MDPQLFERIYDTVVRREPTYDGIYYTAVKTTHIVCRPSCRARTPKAANVVFYGSCRRLFRQASVPVKDAVPKKAAPSGRTRSWRRRRMPLWTGGSAAS